LQTKIWEEYLDGHTVCRENLIIPTKDNLDELFNNVNKKLNFPHTTAGIFGKNEKK